MKKVIGRQQLSKCVIVNSVNPRKHLRLKKIPFVPQLSASLANLQCLWDRLAAITQIQKSPPSPIKLQQRWSHSAPGVRKQCCSGNFRASPPVAFTIFFWSKMPHNCAFSLHFGSSHMLMFYSLCESGCIMKGRPRLVSHWHSLPTSKHMKY